MRPTAFALLTLAALPAVLPAQDAFQGSVTYRMTMDGQSMNATFMSKGSNARMEMTMPGMPGQIVMLMNAEEKVMRIIMGSMGMYMETDMKEPAREAPSTANAPRVEKLGTSEEIAGIRCQNYRFREGDNPPTEACIATGMGYFMGMSGMAAMGGGNRRGAQADTGPNWGSYMSEFTDGMLPLRVRVRRGEEWATVLEAVEVVRKALADELFRLPSGLRKMPSMGRGGEA